MKKYIFLFVFTVIVTSLINIVYVAAESEFASQDIKSAIEADFKSNHVNSMDATKFNNNSTTSFNEAILGDGIAYYTISQDDNSPLVFAGYKFPVYLNGKPISTLTTDNNSGEWKVYQISDSIDLINKIKKAEDKINGNGHFKLIYDESYRIDAAYVQDNTSTQVVDFFNKKIYNSEEFNNLISNIKKEKLKIKNNGNKDFGGISSSGESSILIVIASFSTIILLIAISTFLFLKNKKRRVNN